MPKQKVHKSVGNVNEKCNMERKMWLKKKNCVDVWAVLKRKTEVYMENILLF